MHKTTLNLSDLPCPSLNCTLRCHRTSHVQEECTRQTFIQKSHHNDDNLETSMAMLSHQSQSWAALCDGSLQTGMELILNGIILSRFNTNVEVSAQYLVDFPFYGTYAGIGLSCNLMT